MQDKSNLLTLGIVVLFTTTNVAANDFTLDWWTIDGGGTMWTAGGDFELSSTIGQSDASTTVMTGGDFELNAGFWPAVEEFCFGDFDGDREIGLSDLAQLLGYYGETGGMNYEKRRPGWRRRCRSVRPRRTPGRFTAKTVLRSR